MSGQLRIAYLIDPRFSGGTSSAFASELRVTAKFARVSVHAVSSAMFKGNSAAPQIQSTLKDLGLELVWDQPAVSADVVVLHNPSFLKHNTHFDINIVARHLVIVAHENFQRPGGMESYDVGHCLRLIDRASLSLRKSIAPVSHYNRSTISKWLGLHPQHRGWSVFQQDWFNICDFEAVDPVKFPTDRRGRHSRPGYEKFPDNQSMDFAFPSHADVNVILGGDMFMNDNSHRQHWKVFPFRQIDLKTYFDMFDFMVYFTAPTCQESFGRVLAESIAAGKVVISDPDTASNFDGAVIPGTPQDVDKIINDFISHPAQYQKHVKKAQRKLSVFSSAAFQKNVLSKLALNFGFSA